MKHPGKKTCPGQEKNPEVSILPPRATSSSSIPNLIPTDRKDICKLTHSNNQSTCERHYECGSHFFPSRHGSAVYCSGKGSFSLLRVSGTLLMYYDSTISQGSWREWFFKMKASSQAILWSSLTVFWCVYIMSVCLLSITYTTDEDGCIYSCRNVWLIKSLNLRLVKCCMRYGYITIDTIDIH